MSWLDHPAYEFSYSILGADGTKTIALCRVVKIGELMYSLQAISMGNLADDPELSAIAASFRIIVAEDGQNKTLKKYLGIAAIGGLLVPILGYWLSSRRRLVRLISDVKAVIKRWAEAGFSTKAAEEEIKLAGGPQAMVDKLMSYVKLGDRLAPDKASAVRLLSVCGSDGMLALGKLALWGKPGKVHSAAIEALNEISGREPPR